MPDTQINIQSEETAIEFIQEQVAIDFVQEQVAIEFVQETTQIDFVSENIVLNLTGVPGPVGPPGADGADGVGVPAGGSAGQVLAKIDGDDYNTEWVDQDGGGGPGGASITEITYADMQTAITGGTLTEGAFYRITDAAGTDLGFVCQAIKTNEITVNGTGGYLNADFQAAGDYTGVEAVTGVVFMTPIGIWRTGFEVITIPYTNLSGGTFTVGDTITGGTSGATAVIVTDDGASSMTAYMTSAGVAFDGSEVLDNEAGVTADQGGAAGTPTIVQGDVVIWNLLHWQLTDATLLDGTDPETNTAAYTQLLKTDAGQGYIAAWDVSEFDFAANLIEYRQDLRGGLVRGNVGVSGYQFGRDDCGGNNIQSPATFDIRNLIAAFNNNTTYPGANVSDLTTGAGTTAENNILENSGSLTGITAGANCSISRNKIGQGATLGGSTTMGDGSTIEGFSLGASATVESLQMGDYRALRNWELFSGSYVGGVEMANNDSDFVDTNQRNRIGVNASIDTLFIAKGAEFTGNMFDAGDIEEVTIGEFSSFSANIVSNGSVIATNIGDGVSFSNNVINAAIVSKEITTTIEGNTFAVGADEPETISVNIEGNRAISGFSDIPGTIDITGLTTLDCTAAFAQYRGIYNLTSSNATENIDTITNPPTAFPFTIRPAAGLVLTITGTAYSGIAAGQIALKAASYALDGDKGEYIVLEIDPRGTGCLIEKYVGNGLI